MTTVAYVFILMLFNLDGTNLGATTVQTNTQRECLELQEYAAAQAELNKAKMRAVGGCFKDLGQAKRES